MNKIQGKYGKIYQFDEVIGQGSFGRVYRSSDKYAVKQIVLPKQNSKLMEYLKTQIKILTKINHKNLLSAIQVIQKPPFIYIVMDLCQSDLLNYIKKNKIDQNEAQQILKQTLEGFKELNKNCIVHRDLKPGNILIAKDKSLKISDFGLAKFTDSLSQSLFSQVGTKIYMSPQVLNGQKYTSKCDIYSIGVIYYQLLTGGFPWYPHQVGKKALKLPQNISSISKDLLKKMLQYEEKNRIDWNQLNYQVERLKCENSIPPIKNLNTSKIVTSSNEMKKLASFFLPRVLKSVTLLYRASQNNFLSQKFHDKCDGIGQTLTLIETEEGKKLGGYTPVKWRGYVDQCGFGGGKFASDDSMKSFLFSLTQGDKIQLKKKQKAVYHYRCYGPSFGGGCDLAIRDTGDKCASYANIGHTYMNNRFKQGDQQSHKKFSGDYNFFIKQWEVWAVQFA